MKTTYTTYQKQQPQGGKPLNGTGMSKVDDLTTI